MSAELRRLIDQLGEYELMSAEGVQYAPSINIELDEDGEVVRLEVGLHVTMPAPESTFGDEDWDHETHTLMLVPSTATDEGHGTGNAFLYEDDDALTHVAWGGAA